MNSMKCFECVLKHIATALSYGKEILSGHTIGNELDHRIDFLGQITNAEHHIQLIDNDLFLEISNYRKTIQSKKILIDAGDLTFLRELYIKVELMEDDKPDIVYQQMLVQPVIVYEKVTNTEYFNLSLNSLKTHLKGYYKIVVLQSDFDLTGYGIQVLNMTLKDYAETAKNDFILMYENTGFLKDFEAKKIANSFSTKKFDDISIIGYLRKLGINRPVYNYDYLKPCRIKPQLFRDAVKDYSGKNPVTAYVYLANQNTNLNDVQTTVYIDRAICCSTKNQLKYKPFVRWNKDGFDSLKTYMELTISGK